MILPLITPHSTMPSSQTCLGKRERKEVNYNEGSQALENVVPLKIPKPPPAEDANVTLMTVCIKETVSIREETLEESIGPKRGPSHERRSRTTSALH